MAYENADYINQLDQNLPRGSDTISEGDVHLRTIKEVLKKSFPNVNDDVNAIHTGEEEPTLHSAGTVWFDTSTGLIKIRDKTDEHWLTMAHGEANGVGQMLRADWYEAPGANFRWNDQELIKVPINPLSPSSTYFITVSSQTGVWSDSRKQSIYCKLMDLTTDVQIGQDMWACGFNHIDDVGNFEIHSTLNMKERYQNHPDEEFELAFIAWCDDPDNGGGNITNIKMEVLEIE